MIHLTENPNHVTRGDIFILFSSNLSSFKIGRPGEGKRERKAINLLAIQVALNIEFEFCVRDSMKIRTFTFFSFFTNVLVLLYYPLSVFALFSSLSVFLLPSFFRPHMFRFSLFHWPPFLWVFKIEISKNQPDTFQLHPLSWMLQVKSCVSLCVCVTHGETGHLWSAKLQQK